MKTVTIDHVTFNLQEPHDFSWLSSLGTVFEVFDEQDSGNLCFGVQKDGNKQFVKYAGAKPVDYKGDPADAVERLKQAIPVYKDLPHEHLISFHDDFSTSEGHVAIFDWFNGECLHSHWSYPPPAKYNHPDSPYYKFKQLPIEDRIKAFDEILSFHVYVESKGYVAVDFYDGSLLYDFDTNTMKICDIDFYTKSPVINKTGDFWGSRRSKAPEEYQKGAVIDTRSNVYTLGAIAFSIFGGETDRSFDRWDAGERLFQVVSKAVSEERWSRFDSLREFQDIWNQVKRERIS
ncbi:serine/threonine protein kinase [Halobacillus locisalis]|uniref:Serine/threonine protein kinase n=1 Tax=Halobacillus locisalis TaxID=220753 RepID=A0A838CQ81_9BACI|nr:serine/threonine protein kinase [Halobacillus locisalis]MBA2174227.1 serine/threonine protein kinase [Halobacillus locisalis]